MEPGSETRDTPAIQLDDEHPARELMRLAWPMIGVSVSRLAMGFLDFVMVSRLGTAAQAAISPATVFLWAILSLGMGPAGAVQTFVSQADGRGRRRDGATYVWQTFYIAIAVGILIIPLAAMMPALFRLLTRAASYPAGVGEQAAAFCRIALHSFIPATICAGLEGFFNGARRPRLSFASMLVSIAVNAVGNYMLIFGHWGAPKMGIEGSAVATVIGWWTRAILMMAAFLSADVNRDWGTRAAWRANRVAMRGIGRVGGPLAAQWLIDIMSWVVFMNLIMPRFGASAMAATNIAVQYLHFGFMPAIGVGFALRSLVGFAMGAGRPDQAELRVRLAARILSGYMLTIGVALALFRGPLIAIMTNDPAHDSEVIATGSLILIWAAIFQGFDGFGICYTNALQGAGDTRGPALYFTLYCWGIFITGGSLMAKYYPELGLHGPWLMCAIYICGLGLTLRARFWRGAWKNIKIFKDAPEGDLPPEPILPA